MKLKILHLYPDLLNLYGDRGNLTAMRRRLEWRGIECEITELPAGKALPQEEFDDEDGSIEEEDIAQWLRETV